METTSSSSDNVSFEELENRVPEMLTVLKNDKALSDMILDMVTEMVIEKDRLLNIKA